MSLHKVTLHLWKLRGCILVQNASSLAVLHFEESFRMPGRGGQGVQSDRKGVSIENFDSLRFTTQPDLY